MNNLRLETVTTDDSMLIISQFDPRGKSLRIAIETFNRTTGTGHTIVLEEKGLKEVVNYINEYRSRNKESELERMLTK